MCRSQKTNRIRIGHKNQGWSQKNKNKTLTVKVNLPLLANGNLIFMFSHKLFSRAFNRDV